MLGRKRKLDVGTKKEYWGYFNQKRMQTWQWAFEQIPEWSKQRVNETQWVELSAQSLDHMMMQTNGRVLEDEWDVCSGCLGLIQPAPQALAIPAPGVGRLSPLSSRCSQASGKINDEISTHCNCIPRYRPKGIESSTQMSVCECSQQC